MSEYFINCFVDGYEISNYGRIINKKTKIMKSFKTLDEAILFRNHYLTNL